MVKPIEKPAIKHRKMNDVRLVVGIGASAGGLEALQQFFLKLPANSNIAFVIVQHLSPDYKSLMAEILGKYTPMQVVQAEHLQEVAPNRVYLIPPKKNLTIKAGHLLLTDYDHRAINHPIDVFFTSLAEESCDRAVGIVLSGTGSDGTNGIKSIKEHGGIVMAQDRQVRRNAAQRHQHGARRLCPDSSGLGRRAFESGQLPPDDAAASFERIVGP